MPQPTPTDEQIVSVRRVAGLRDRAEAERLVSALNDAEWERARALLNKWAASEDKFAALDGKVKLDPQDKRNAVRREMRTLLGLSPFSDEELGPGVSGSGAVPVEVWW